MAQLMRCPETSYPFGTTETGLSIAYTTVTATEVAPGTSITTITGNILA
jgi:hypothetical protein